MSPREIEIARRLFRIYDDSHQGNITEVNAKKAIAAYYTLFIECDDTLNGWVMKDKTFWEFNWFNLKADSNCNQQKLDY